MATNTTNGGTLGFEKKLWASADALRSNMDAAEYKHVVLGLIFLKYISDVFAEHRARLEQEPYADPEDRDEYLAANVFWVPPEARWETLQNNAKQPNIGKIVDDAMDAIERENPSLKGVLPKNYNRPGLSAVTLGQLIDLFANLDLGGEGARARDTLGRVYEYFLGQFASAEGRKGGQFYTPQSVVRLLVEMIAPYRGRVYDPCCGSGGMFVQSEKFIEAHGGTLGDISIYGQESNYTTWRLAKMNLAIRQIDGDLRHGDTFLNNQHRDLRADYILANPPFNLRDWGQEKLKSDPRWVFGLPPANNANFAWLQHILYHLAPGGYAGVVLANGSMSSTTSGEGEIRQRMVEADLVDCMVALPAQLFYSTQIPACLWFLTKDKDGRRSKTRDRRGEVLFIDARQMGEMEDRTHRALTEEEIARIAATYHAWRSAPPSPAGRGAGGEGYTDIPGFCAAVPLERIREHNFVLTPGRYVGAPEVEEDGEPFEEKMARLTAELYAQMQEARRLDEAIRRNLAYLGYNQDVVKQLRPSVE